MLDTGATVTIIPKEFVKSEDMTGVTISAKCANAATLILQEANVKLLVGNMILHRRVGVPQSEEIESEALLSFDLHNLDERQQLQDVMAHHDATKAKGAVLNSVVDIQGGEVSVEKEAEKTVVGQKLDVYAEEWGLGFDLLFKKSGNNCGNDKKKSKVVVTESSDDSVPVVGEEELESAKLVVEDSLILEPLKESKDIKELNSQTEND